jgi:hypothetical protein
MQRYKSKISSVACPVLSTESKEQYESLLEGIRNKIKPQDPIEDMYCDEIVRLHWEILRWWRARDAALNGAMQNALYDILVEQLSEIEGGEETIDYLGGWLTSEEIRSEVLDILKKRGMGQADIEAVAFRLCATDIMHLEQILASATSRRDRALHMLAAYRESFSEPQNNAAKGVKKVEVLQLQRQA